MNLIGGKINRYTSGNNPYGFNFTSNAPVNDGHWHLFVAQRDSDGTGAIYVDGKLDSSQKAATVPLASGFHVYIGEDVRDAVDVGPAYLAGSNGQDYLIDIVNPFSPLVEPAILAAFGRR